MRDYIEINYIEVDENTKYEQIVSKVINECFKEEKFEELNIYVNIIFTTPENIKEINKKYRNIDKPTDVLSFPMFEKVELEDLSILNKPIPQVLGDIVISISQVEKQAIEYEHSFERELAYMVVHGFYHIIGYDHIEEKDKPIMRQKEETVLNKLKIIR